MGVDTADSSVKVKEFIVEIPVSDLSKSTEWYSKLFGRKPDLEPFPGNVEFKVGKAWVQISEGEVKQSNWLVNLEVLDLHREYDRIKESNIYTTEIKERGGVVSWFDAKDPDGNSIRFYKLITSESESHSL